MLVEGTRYRALSLLLACACLTGCVQRTITTTVHRGPRVGVGFDVREADGATTPVAVRVQLPERVLASTAFTPWRGSYTNVDDGALVQIDASRSEPASGHGVLRCRIDTFGGEYVLEMVVRSRDACQMRVVVTAADVNIGAITPGT